MSSNLNVKKDSNSYTSTPSDFSQYVKEQAEAFKKKVSGEIQQYFNELCAFRDKKIQESKIALANYEKQENIFEKAKKDFEFYNDNNTKGKLYWAGVQKSSANILWEVKRDSAARASHTAMKFSHSAPMMMA